MGLRCRGAVGRRVGLADVLVERWLLSWRRGGGLRGHAACLTAAAAVLFSLVDGWMDWS